MNSTTIFNWTLNIIHSVGYAVSSIAVVNALSKIIAVSIISNDDLLARLIVVVLMLQSISAIIYTNFIILSQYLPYKYNYTCYFKVPKWIKTLFMIGFALVVLISLEYLIMSLTRIRYWGWENGRFGKSASIILHIYGSLYYTCYDMIKYH